MTMSEERMEKKVRELLEGYHVPGDAPREEMWKVISSRLDVSETDVVDISVARQRRVFVTNKAVAWAVAATAVLALGVGIGRVTVTGWGVNVSVGSIQLTPTSIAFAAQEHMSRTESLLTMVQTDARAGRVDPMTAQWARGLLSQTRLLMDVQVDEARLVNDLLLDLELVLVQIVGVAETGSMDEARARTELELALRSLEEGEVLPRIRAAFSAGLSGT